MTAILIVIEEHGFPVELAGPEIARAVGTRRLRAESIVKVHVPGEHVISCLASEVPLLQPLLGIQPSSPQPLPTPSPRLQVIPISPAAALETSWAHISSLQRGQNIALSDIAHINVHMVVISGEDVQSLLEIDFSAFLLNENGRVRGDADFIYYNNDGYGGFVIRHGTTDHLALGSVDTFQVTLGSVDHDVQRICFAASIHDGEIRTDSFRHVRQATIAIDDAAGMPIARYDLNEPDSPETALILGELYRRGDWWKFRAVGQGFVGGLAALATSFGLDVRDGGE